MGRGRKQWCCYIAIYVDPSLIQINFQKQFPYIDQFEVVRTNCHSTSRYIPLRAIFSFFSIIQCRILIWGQILLRYNTSNVTTQHWITEFCRCQVYDNKINNLENQLKEMHCTCTQMHITGNAGDNLQLSLKGESYITWYLANEGRRPKFALIR